MLFLTLIRLSERQLDIILKMSLYSAALHSGKYRNFTSFPGVKILWKDDLAESMRKLNLSTKCPH